MKKPLICFAALILLFSFTNSPVRAQKKVDLGGTTIEQSGMYFRLNLGFGSGSSTYGDVFKLSGGGLTFGGRIGYRASGKIGIHGLLSGMSFTRITSDNIYYSADGLAFTSLGGGLSIYFGKGYSYFMPEIVYTMTGLTNGGNVGTTQGGFGFNLLGGYDFNIARKMGLGMNGIFHYGSMKDQGDNPPTVKNIYYGIEITLRFGK